MIPIHPLHWNLATAVQHRRDSIILILAALGKLALGCRGRPTGNPLTTSHFLLALSNVMKVLGVDGLFGVLLRLSSRTSPYWAILASDLHLGFRDLGNCLAVKVAGMGLSPGPAGICGL